MLYTRQQAANSRARHTFAVVCTDTYHGSQQCMSGQFPFYHEYEAMQSCQITLYIPWGPSYFQWAPRSIQG